MKLINWHRFQNETINFENQVLLSGENGAGKSTLLDALQFVMTCSKSHFNKAAHENGKRKLAGYVRCKTGKEQKPFERTGEVTAHIALEFYEEEKDKNFVIGAVVDSASETQEKTLFYRMENKCLDDELFLNGRTPRNIELFKKSNKLAFASLYMNEAQKDFRNRFGRLEKKFNELIPKALAFKPIDNIKDFVYSYVLDEKAVNIEVLKENVRSYQDLEKLLALIKVKIEKLQTISEAYDKLQNCEKNEQIYTYYIQRAEWDIMHQLIQSLEKDLRALKAKDEETFVREVQIQNRLVAVTKEMDDLTYELLHNKDYIAYKNLENKMSETEEQYKRLKIEEKELIEKLTLSLKNAQGMKKYETEEAVGQYEEALSQFKIDKKAESFRPQLEEYVAYKLHKSEELTSKLALKELEKTQLSQKISDLDQRIEKLKKNQLQYDMQLIELIQDIKTQFKKLHIKDEPRILCELLNIVDPRWTDAVEGYLNTQRFYLLVEPQNFDIAASTYEKVRKQKGLHSIGIINAGKLEKYDTCEEGSLAEAVTSESIGASRFINMLLGKVIKCEKVEELKQHKVAITPSCMLYQNHVVRGINPKIYSTPYIGKEAYKVQLLQAQEEKQSLQNEHTFLNKRIGELQAYKRCFQGNEEAYIGFHIDLPQKAEYLHDQLKELRDNKKKLEQNNTYLSKQLLLEEKKKDKQAIEADKDRCIREQADLMAEIKQKQKDLEHKRDERIVQQQRVIAIEEKLESLLDKAQRDYQMILLQKKNPYKLKEDYEGTLKRNETTKAGLEEECRNMMLDYKRAFDFGAEASRKGFPLFQQEFNKLKNSKVLQYEEKVYQARTAAEFEFKEHFLSKLNENITKAQQEFKRLNRALEDISFGQEKYQFKYGESKRFSKYYRMIMDELNMLEGFSLLTGAFNEKHKEVIDELFEKLTLDEENSSKVLEEFTDYRTYMDYDIYIDHGDGTHSYYSKVAEEKSGGETQTPFYVTIAASFMQLYTSGIGDSIGLVMFDEAFNNMDDERINGILTFLNKLPLQMIIAAPPDKIQYIGPYMKSTLLVLKDENISYVEAYGYESV
jgi:uncharacterized protein YPO0396